MSKPRSDAVIRKFLGGDDTSDLTYWVEANTSMPEWEARSYVEGCIRRALSRKWSKP